MVGPAVLGMAVAWVWVLPAEAQRPIELPSRDARLDGGLTTVFSVGKAEGESWETFSNVPSVAFDRSGSLHVLDRDNARVLVFDRNGRYQRQVGRKGEGPGELGLPLALAVTPDDRVVVFDLANNALTVFGADGRYERVVRPPPGVRAGPGVRMSLHPSGGVVLAGSQLPDPDAGLTPRATVPLVLVPLDGSPARTLYEAPSPPPEVTAAGGEQNRQVRVMPPPAFSPQVSFATLADGRLAVVHGVDYAVRLVGPSGVAGVITRSIPPRAVSERDRNAAKERRREALRTGAGAVRMEVVNGRRSVSMGGGGMPEPMIEQMLAGMKFAETVQLLRGVAVDREGRLWLSRDGGPGRYEEGPIDLVAGDGRYVGTVSGIRAPDAFGPNGLAAYIEADDLDVPRVVVRQIPSAWK